MELNEIMVNYGTDKQELIHNYVQHYNKYFEQHREKKLKILEIGIFRPDKNSNAVPGASLKTWRDYFLNSEIYGIDLGDFTDVNDDRIKTMIANQEIRIKNSEWNGLTEMIDNFGGDFDIIIDDGGHSMEQQQVSLGFLFKFLKPGGIFVIEDLETSYKWGWAYNKTNTEYDTLSMLKIFNQTNKIMSDFITDDEKNYLNQNIDKIFIEKGNHSEISFIYKK
jgi:hypothetical protein